MATPAPTRALPSTRITTDSGTTAVEPQLRIVHTGRAPARSTQQQLPLEWHLPGGIPATPPLARHLRVVGSPTPPPTGHIPDPAAWVARIAPAILEVIAAERPATQLARWAARDVFTTLARRHAAAARHPAGRDRRPPCRRIRSVRLCPIAPGIIEASAVITGVERTRAIALRLELIHRPQRAEDPRWLITACEIG
jgi:hypothetical protein